MTCACTPEPTMPQNAIPTTKKRAPQTKPGVFNAHDRNTQCTYVFIKNYSGNGSTSRTNTQHPLTINHSWHIKCNIYSIRGSKEDRKSVV